MLIAVKVELQPSLTLLHFSPPFTFVGLTSTSFLGRQNILFDKEVETEADKEVYKEVDKEADRDVDLDIGKEDEKCFDRSLY